MSEPSYTRYMNYREAVLQFAEEAHRGQTRRDGSPYFNHVKNVIANGMMLKCDATVFVCCAFHDIIEDGRKTEVEVKDFLYEWFQYDILFADNILGILRVLNHKDKDYEQYIVDIRDYYDERVKLVKIADILDNVSDARCTEKQRKKYRDAIELLRS